MAEQLLKDVDLFPDDGVLENALGGVFPVYEEFMKTITGEEHSLLPEWRYYNDGKAWLCKIQYKKKTVVWLSVWEGHFRLSFFFTEKNGQDIAELDIDDGLKRAFFQSKTVGKLKPLILEISRMEQLSDALTITAFKKKLK
ncbi:MAG: DUF3788 domain-containing protein [Spirochaetaceae bacterium]|jgi:hypothetical protein|nr:DUF3788 domain-containing protein [Spirochaetaceae bacterium]